MLCQNHTIQATRLCVPSTPLSAPGCRLGRDNARLVAEPGCRQLGPPSPETIAAAAGDCSPPGPGLLPPSLFIQKQKGRGGSKALSPAEGCGHRPAAALPGHLPSSSSLRRLACVPGGCSGGGRRCPFCREHLQIQRVIMRPSGEADPINHPTQSMGRGHSRSVPNRGSGRRWPLLCAQVLLCAQGC